jgi:hypothetical protein
LIKQDGSSVLRIEKPVCEPRESLASRASPSLILRLLRRQLLLCDPSLLAPDAKAIGYLKLQAAQLFRVERGNCHFYMTAIVLFHDHS